MPEWARTSTTTRPKLSKEVEECIALVEQEKKKKCAGRRLQKPGCWQNSAGAPTDLSSEDGGVLGAECADIGPRGHQGRSACAGLQQQSRRYAKCFSPGDASTRTWAQRRECDADSQVLLTHGVHSDVRFNRIEAHTW
ncbi:hypothetical protein F4604DRAFT_1687037 [Suillus subluteus]|nr:hypothetical protein F4604DRAFT_1687037 [Suillus subluteus]